MKTILDITREHLSKYDPLQNPTISIQEIISRSKVQSESGHKRMHDDPALEELSKHYGKVVMQTFTQLPPEQLGPGMKTAIVLAIMEWEQINHEYNKQFQNNGPIA